ncbi:MBL fold metallo-hydrolase [Chloroflexi bacterium]|nr:MBL fold metallo-hydrolase [Chloroflexota bacterium]
MQEKLKVGDVEIISLMDMIPPPRPPDEFFPDVDQALWEPYKEEVLDKGLVQLYYGCFVVISKQKTVLVDTGIGPGPHPTRGNKKGNLLNDLQRKNIKPQDIDIVVHSHLHIDHVGWNLDLSLEPPIPFFPNARYLVPSIDWDHFTKPENLSNAPWVSENVIPLEALSLMDLFGDDFSVTDEITSLLTPGHTPGHMSFILSSAGQKAAIVGDAIHSRVQINEPSWCAGVDIDKVASEKSRRYLMEKSISEGMVLAAGHFHPNEHFGRVFRQDHATRWESI